MFLGDAGHWPASPATVWGTAVRKLYAMIFVCFCTVWMGAQVQAQDFIFGADLSFANEMEDCGARYSDGERHDVFAIFHAHGTNLVRIRLWNAPTDTKYSTLKDVRRAIARAKANGMQVLLDFHYSDSWADGDKQIIPAAWAGIKDPDALADTLYRYTFDTLTALDKDGLMPDMVQVGNETNIDMLADAPAEKGAAINWGRNAKLLNAGIRAVRDAGKQTGHAPKVMLHIAQPENAGPWFADAARAGVTDFDVIGLSYYPKWSRRTLAGLQVSIAELRRAYPKVAVMVVETAYPWSLGWRDNTGNVLGKDSLLPGFPATPEGQKAYLVALTQRVINGGGSGVVTWAPDWVSTSCRTQWGTGSSWENATLFDFDGNALPGLDFPRAAYRWPDAAASPAP